MITYVPERLRSANIRKGVIGSLARVSMKANASSRTTATTKDPMARPLCQSFSAARMKPYTSATMPSVEVSAPAMSKRPGWRSDSLMYIGVRTAISTPMGTLTKSTQRQSSHSVSMPPASSPIAPPPAETAANTPNARFRSGPSGKVVVMSASDVGDAIAPPTPCSARATSSCQGSWASPPSSEAAVNSRMPVMKTRRRPRMSPARPPRSSRPPKVRVYALTTHVRSVVLNSSAS